jgi:ABC-type branched-subunit amino acid transport system ATPase component
VPLLEACGVVAGYGETEILHGVSITVDEGEVVTIIGPNGCGKSTLMKAIVGLVRVRNGRVTFRGREISSSPPETIVRTGLCYVPQTNNVFPSLSIRENLEMGAFVRRDDFRERIDDMFEVFPDLAVQPGRKAGSLSGGQRQMLAIARAMMLDPKIILLDEPTEGLMPRLVGQIREIIDVLRQANVSILLVEQNVPMTLAVSDRVYLMERGAIRHEAAASELSVDDDVIHKYLGV